MVFFHTRLGKPYILFYLFPQSLNAFLPNFIMRTIRYRPDDVIQLGQNVYLADHGDGDNVRASAREVLDFFIEEAGRLPRESPERTYCFKLLESANGIAAGRRRLKTEYAEMM